MVLTRATCLCLLVAVYTTLTVDAHPHARSYEARKYENYGRRYYSDPNNCARCLPGWGLVTICNYTHPTVCSPCTGSTWTPRYSHLRRCQQCSKCGEGLYEEYKCSATRDTRCNGCHAHKGVLTDDFVRKCKSIDSSAADNQESRESQESFALDKAQEEEQRNDKNVGVPDDGNSEHEFFNFNKLKNIRGPMDVTNERIGMKPSYHGYEVDPYDLKERLRMAAYRQKAYILLGFAAILMIIALVFFVWLLRECRRPVHRVIPARTKLYVHLTEQDNEIIRQCAARLRGNGKIRTESECAENDEYWEEPMRLTENPLEYLKFGSTEQLLPKDKC